MRNSKFWIKEGSLVVIRVEKSGWLFSPYLDDVLGVVDVIDRSENYIRVKELFSDEVHSAKFEEADIVLLAESFAADSSTEDTLEALQKNLSGIITSLASAAIDAGKV